jgi:ankyrin repeat protein
MIRRALDDFPGSLEETYERALLDIGVEKRQYAHRLFQCLMVSRRPLRVEELAEVLAIQFDGALPTYNSYWSPKNPQEAVLSACSSLITVVTVNGSSTVQFSHSSVKEFLTSERLSNSRENLSHFYIHPQSAHTTFAEAALSVLLDGHADEKGVLKSPLSIYAAQQWAYHYNSGKVSPRIHVLVEHLVVTLSLDINAGGGYYSTSLHAAVITGNLDIALVLLNHGANVNTLDDEGWSPLHRASRRGRLDALELLLEQQADVNILGNDEQTPLYLASQDGKLEVARTLLRYGAAVDARNKKGWTPLIAASRFGHLALAQLLIQNGAALDSHDNKSWTPLQPASGHGRPHIVRELVDWGADVNAQKHDLWTGLDLASCARNFEILQFLPIHRTFIDVKNKKGEMPLDRASGNGEPEIAELLINHGADMKSKDDHNWTPYPASWDENLEVVHLLLKFMKDINIPNKNLKTPPASESRNGQLDVSSLLIKRVADVNFSDNTGWTSLHWVSRYQFDILWPLRDDCAVVNVRQEILWTPLHLVSANGYPKIADLLVQKGAYGDKGNKIHRISSYWTSVSGKPEIGQPPAKHGPNAHSQDVNGCTSLHALAAAQDGHLDIVKLFPHLCADVNSRKFNNMTPLDLAFSNKKLGAARSLAESPHTSAGIVPIEYKSDNRRSTMQSSLSNLRDILYPSMKKSFGCMSHHSLGILKPYNHFMMSASSSGWCRQKECSN